MEKQRELLKLLRSRLTGSEHTLPFTIFKDSEIESLLKAQPKTIEQLSKVKGFPAGGKRVKGYGDAIIAIFKGADITDFGLKGTGEDVKVTTTIKKSAVFN